MQTYYYQLDVKPSDHYALFLDLISELTDEAIEELDGKIIIRDEVELDNLKDGVENFALQLSEALNQEITVETKLSKNENEDWINKYKNSIQPVDAGRFYIHPTWNESKDGKINVKIDPALAFGSGHHETTNSCLLMIDKYVNDNQTLLDVGCGSGILSIAASKLGAKVDICDTDPLSIENSETNFSLNDSKYENAWVGSAVAANKTYDVVIANIVADVLVLIAADLKKCLNPNGILILSGILTIHKDKILNKFKQYEVLEIVTKGDWETMVLKRIEK